MMVTKTEVTAIRKKAKKGEVLAALKQLEETTGGIITPYDVVEMARDPASPLHTAFEWDNTKAAEKYRLMQARILLTTVKVEVVPGQKREAFYNAQIVVDDQPVRGYFSREVVMTDEQLKKEVLRSAIADLERAREKYSEIAELAGVINEDQLRKAKDLVDTP